MKKVIILAAITLMGQSSWGRTHIRDFQTTRLNSTAGAGVASILSTEAAILNPASSAFFDSSSASYQSYTTTLRDKSDERGDNRFSKNNRSQGIFVADHTGPVKGGVAYITQDENNFERKRMNFHSAAPIGDATSLGFSYNYLEDKYPRGNSPRHAVHHQVAAGLIHVLDEDTILGATIVDPTRTTPGEEKIVAGFQYNIASRLTLIGDVGTQYTKDVPEKYLWRAAVQLNIFSDFFLRAGQFYDNINEFKGTGWGVSWVGPRLGVEFAQKFSEQFGENSYIYKDESLVDTSLSLLLKF